MSYRRRKFHTGRRRSGDGFSWDEYYRKNRQSISRRRKQRYENDAAYRKKILEQNKDYYERERKKPPVDRTVIHSPKGVFFTISQFGKIVNREPVTIRQYHRTGVLPEPTHVDTRGWRLYTPEQTAMVKNIFLQYDNKEINREEMIEEIKKGWTDGQEIHG